jgi:2,4-dienoyl-CoA reductase-like NADH-dependent reductase (Old Yellow Enzyme family)
LVGAVGLITDAQQASSIFSEGKADAVFVAREFLRDAGTVLRWARELAVDVGWAVQCEFELRFDCEV